MKKIYSKPEIAYESFSLTTNIASGCEVKTDTPAAMQCGYTMPPNTYFISGVAGCTTEIEEGTTFDSFCYHTPSDLSNLFNS